MPHASRILTTSFLVSALLGAGCQTRCVGPGDCPDDMFCRRGSCELECYVDEDCTSPPECRDTPLTCAPKGLRCTAQGMCIHPINNRAPTPLPEEGPSGPPSKIPGWKDPPGTGHTFVIDTLGIASPGRGANIDQRCRGPGDCVDNALSIVASTSNPQIQQGLVGGQTLIIVELAGLEDDFRGNQEALTVKLYSAHDADEYVRPENNFHPPARETTCCRFKASPASLNGPDGQPGARSPAKIERGRLTSLVPVSMRFTLTLGAPPLPDVRIERATISASLPQNRETLSDGMLAGAIPVSSLATIDNPYCGTPSNLCRSSSRHSSILDMLSALIDPDIDLDPKGNGLGRMIGGADGRVASCLDAHGNEVPPQDPAEPWTCALDPRMEDGYSVGFNFTATQATVVGIGQ